MKASMVILFSQRLALRRAFEKWAEENSATKCVENFIGFLMMNGMLNRDAVIEFLERSDQK